MSTIILTASLSAGRLAGHTLIKRADEREAEINAARERGEQAPAGLVCNGYGWATLDADVTEQTPEDGRYNLDDGLLTFTRDKSGKRVRVGVYPRAPEGEGEAWRIRDIAQAYTQGTADFLARNGIIANPYVRSHTD